MNGSKANAYNGMDKGLPCRTDLFIFIWLVNVPSTITFQDISVVIILIYFMKFGGN